MQPKKQLKVQYIGIFEEMDSFYWPKMHFLKEGQKIWAWVDPPLFGQCPKENVFFLLTSSHSCTTHICCQRMGLGAICFELTLYSTLTHCASDTRWPSCLPIICNQNNFFSITSRSQTSRLYITVGPIHLHTDPDRSWELPSWFCRSGRDQVFLQEKSRRPSFLSSLLCNRGSSLSSWWRCILKLSKVWLENWLDNQRQSMTLLLADGGIQ